MLECAEKRHLLEGEAGEKARSQLGDLTFFECRTIAASIRDEPPPYKKAEAEAFLAKVASEAGNGTLAQKISDSGDDGMTWKQRMDKDASKVRIPQ
jgi:hypothetical protein